MFDTFRLKEVLVQYKKDFLPKHWQNEKLKWEAVKNFQNSWDVNAKDFSLMLTRALSKTGRLLTGPNKFPAAMITGFAKTAPEEVRAMYIELFDESKDLYERINSFKMKSSDDYETGYIYVVKSLSKDPQIASIDSLYKVGFTAGSVKKRIANAENEPTYLYAPVKLIEQFQVINLSAKSLETAIHHALANY